MSSLKQIIAIASESIEQHGVFTKENIKNTFSGGFDNVASGISSAVTGLFSSMDDNVFIPEGTKTLTGDDFSSLYVSSGTNLVNMSDGSRVSMLVAECPYDTEMHSGFGRASEPGSYDILPLRSKAVYEVVLLSKYAAFMSQDGIISPGVSEGDIAGWYADKMSQYREFCESKGLDWNDITCAVSVELQTETRDYLRDGKKAAGVLYTAGSDVSRVVSNRAHNMVLSCADESYVDDLPPSLMQDISYEDTMDVVPKIDGSDQEVTVGDKSKYVFVQLVEKVKSFFVEKWNQITGRDTYGVSVSSMDAGAEQESAVYGRTVDSGDIQDPVPDSVGKIFSNNVKNAFSGLLDYEEEMLYNAKVQNDAAYDGELAKKRGQMADMECFGNDILMDTPVSDVSLD